MKLNHQRKVNEPAFNPIILINEFQIIQFNCWIAVKILNPNCGYKTMDG